ncbi:MAG: hypothetical protein LW694_13430, partial [Chitinophagaceae bacterium]|nr:hypothetical protein [Chitinophagaceae bacterium]
MLDRETWASRVLPAMGWRLGLQGSDNNPFADLDPQEKARVEALGIYPHKPLVTQQEWNDIVSYFSGAAPQQLRQPVIGPEQTLDKEQFQALPLKISAQSVPAISMMAFDTLRHQIYVGDA